MQFLWLWTLWTVNLIDEIEGKKYETMTMKIDNMPTINLTKENSIEHKDEVDYLMEQVRYF